MKPAPARCQSDLCADVRRRAVLLGASNLALGLGAAFETAKRAWGHPLEVLAACGHGRSYGRASRVLARQLPGILECGLWDALARTVHAPIAAVVTDVGNDLLYEHPLEQIVAWVEATLDRLAAVGARTVVTRLPLAAIGSVSPGRYRLFRALFFPRSRLEQGRAWELACALDERIARLAHERGFAAVAQPASWYGLDPIHVRRRQRATAWREVLAHWSPSNAPFSPVGVGIGQQLYLASRRPEQRRVFGMLDRAAQPSCRFADGSSIALY